MGDILFVIGLFMTMLGGCGMDSPSIKIPMLMLGIGIVMMFVSMAIEYKRK